MIKYFLLAIITGLLLAFVFEFGYRNNNFLFVGFSSYLVGVLDMFVFKILKDKEG